jgi:hypothetical protein
MFLNCSTCFGRHTAHHQELKIVIAASSFTYVFGCQPLQRPATKKVCKPRGCNYSFEFLMMGGVSPETCWTIKKHWNNKFYYTVASCWFFLWDLYYYARIHEHQMWKKILFYTTTYCIICSVLDDTHTHTHIIYFSNCDRNMLVSFGAESVVFQGAIQILKDQDI